MKSDRRDFIGLSFASFSAVGGLFTLVGIKKNFDPLPSVIAEGVKIVDLSSCQPGVLFQTQWQKKPIFILKKTPSMKPDDSRDVIVGKDRFIVVIGICTHLGCIPSYNPLKEEFLCACHGGIFNVDGINVFGPPPTPLVIPPFKVEGNKLVLGEEGEEYKKLMSIKENQ